jgi:hypothetical protein
LYHYFQGWPGWASGAAAVGLSIQAAIILDSQWLPDTHRLLPMVEFISGSATSDHFRLLLHPVAVVLSGSDPPGNIHTWEFSWRAAVTFHCCRQVPMEFCIKSS